MITLQYRRSCSIVLVASTTLTAQAADVELITNGSFETGSFSGWNIASQNAFGTFSVDGGTVTALSSNFTVGAAAGTYFAVSDNVAESAQILWQTITIPANTKAELSYQLFANSYAPVAFGAANLNPAGVANQHARVDLLTISSFTSNPYTTTTLANLWQGATALTFGDSPAGYGLHTHDLTPLVMAGGTYILRFGVVANQDVLNLGVDAVSLVATVPEALPPVPLLATGLAIAAGWTFGRRRRQGA